MKAVICLLERSRKRLLQLGMPARGGQGAAGVIEWLGGRQPMAAMATGDGA